VLLAITLDRLTQAMGQPRRGVRHWYQTGPAGFILRLVGGGAARGEAAAPVKSAAAQ
jgi:glycine betaine/proline transport system permease protein